MLLTSDIEANVVSVERLKEYSEISQEAAWEIPDSEPPKDWPSMGRIEFRNLKFRYREGLDFVLNGLSFVIHSGEKIGTVTTDSYLFFTRCVQTTFSRNRWSNWRWEVFFDTFTFPNCRSCRRKNSDRWSGHFDTWLKVTQVTPHYYSSGSSVVCRVFEKQFRYESIIISKEECFCDLK